MKSLLRIAFGLIVDDWWLAAGIVVSVALVYGAIRTGALGTSAAGWLLLALMLATLVLSLRMEYLRARRKKR
jgi:hypothetical protein